MSEASTGTGALFMDLNVPQNCGNYLYPLRVFTDETFLALRIGAASQTNSIRALFPSGSIWCGRNQLASVSPHFVKGTSWQQRCIFFSLYDPIVYFLFTREIHSGSVET